MKTARITALMDLEPDKKSALITSIRAGEYNLFFGAGISLDATNGRGETLPSGKDFKNELCKLTGARSSSSLQRVFSALTPDQVQKHVTERFLRCTPGPSVEKLPTFIWRRVFTLNIDDVLEAVYTQPGNLQTPEPFHFRDTYEEIRTLDNIPIVHLHGWARQPKKGYVFARSEYARLMADSNAWMTVLADIMPVESFIIAGTALDEIDLEYYIARRSSTSQREDRGPSFFVEPYPDAQTERECERYGLNLYQGTLEQFLSELDALVPRRRTPLELVPPGTLDLLPEGTSNAIVLPFSNDFERVPGNAPAGGDAVRFSYGSPPDWRDLSSHWDVGRPLATRIRSIVDAMVAGSIPERILILSDQTGSGKTTIARRVAYDLATQGAVVLECSALSRIDPQTTTEALDLIDDPLIILVDNFADQATSIAAILDMTEKRDAVFLCAERSYRQRHIVRALGDLPYRTISGLDLGIAEASQLVESYVRRGFTSSPKAAKNPRKFAKGLVGEPIAVACCQILNDMRPLDTIVHSTYQAAEQIERDRYLIAALAQVCFKGGVRYEVLASATGRSRWNDQFQPAHPLPLAYVDEATRNFAVPLNSTLAERTLTKAPSADVAKAFERLALGIAARVNREAIRRRAPEARLAGRLFDYEDVIRRFLPNSAGEFYAKVQPAWQWNSRYWEQVALYHLALYNTEKDELRLQQAVQHARHAVAIEHHPFPLTTLGKVLLAQLGLPGMSNTSIYTDAQEYLVKAIHAERHRGRASVHAFVTLFRGALDYLDLGFSFTAEQLQVLKDMTAEAANYFPRDRELQEVTRRLRAQI